MNRYLMVQRDDTITIFYDEFINYGFNKITYVEKLRYSNYSFYLASKLYAFDLPHHGYGLLIGIRNRSKMKDLHLKTNKVGKSNIGLYSKVMKQLKKNVQGDGIQVKGCVKNVKLLTPISWFVLFVGRRIGNI